MKRRRFKQFTSLQDRLSAFAEAARETAEKLRPGIEREIMVRKATHADTAAHLPDWANSPGLQPPE
jgi:hypothetical protein